MAGVQVQSQNQASSQGQSQKFTFSTYARLVRAFAREGVKDIQEMGAILKEGRRTGNSVLAKLGNGVTPEQIQAAVATAIKEFARTKQEKAIRAGTESPVDQSGLKNNPSVSTAEKEKKQEEKKKEQEKEEKHDEGKNNGFKARRPAPPGGEIK